MKHIIVADIRGVKYYIKATQLTYHGAILQFSFEGLRDNATKFSDKEIAKIHRDKLEVKTDWSLSVEPV